MKRIDSTLDVEVSDAALVAESLAGSREAFGRIVARYQNLICSLAYSATGNLGQSEDLAQDTFLAAWKQLPSLRDADRLRAWLCQIARNHICDFLRSQGREPSHAAEPLDSANEARSVEPQPVERTIAREEQEILWRSLERIPEVYREPLVLFYREGESIEQVARKLELSEDAVKQRLSRGRKLLANEVTALVERTLKQTAPGRAFTAAVLVALPALTCPSSAAAAGAAAVEEAVTAKTIGSQASQGGSWFAATLLPILGTYLGYRAGIDGATSEEERSLTRIFYGRLVACILGFGLLITPVITFSRALLDNGPHWLAGAVLASIAAYVVSIIWLSLWVRRAHRRLADRQIASGQANLKALEYRSRATFLGLPLIHVCLGGSAAATRQDVKAWIAVGGCAFGGLFAFGGMAVAPIAVGGFAVGLFSFGGLSIAALGLGGVVVAWWGIGGVVAAVEAFAACAVAWHTAVGGVAIARDMALGHVAHAIQCNNSLAAQSVRDSLFFQSALVTMRHIVWLHLGWVIPMVFWWRKVARSRKTRG